MIALRGIECLERLHFCDDGPRVDFCRVELRYVGLRDALLLFAGIENGGAVLGAGIGPWRFHCVGSWATEKKTIKSWP